MKRHDIQFIFTATPVPVQDFVAAVLKEHCGLIFSEFACFRFAAAFAHDGKNYFLIKEPLYCQSDVEMLMW
ncbi:hypothetical protein DSECCO2_663130 [anaerobic digester metagenome]